MRLSIYAVLLSLLMLATPVLADGYSGDQIPKGKISHYRKKWNEKMQWYIGDLKVTPDVIAAAIESNPEAASEYSMAKVFYYPGTILAGVGGAALGWGIVAWLDGDKRIGKPLTFGGLGTAAIAILLGHISGIYSKSAIEIYNKSVDAKNSFSVQVLPTEQGGLGLALAF